MNIQDETQLQNYVQVLIRDVYSQHKNNRLVKYLPRDNYILENNSSSIPINASPENLYFRVCNFQSDFWQVAYVIWSLIETESQNIPNIYNCCDHTDIKLKVFQFELKSPRINQTNFQISEECLDTINKMLNILQFNRISNVNLINYWFNNISNNNQQELNEMIQFYEKEETLEDLYEQFIQQESDIDLLFYYIKHRDSYKHFFGSELLYIQMIVFVYHLSFNYSNNKQTFRQINELLIRYLLLVSIKLKEKLIMRKINQVNTTIDEINELKHKIIENHNKLLNQELFMLESQFNQLNLEEVKQQLRTIDISNNQQGINFKKKILQFISQENFNENMLIIENQENFNQAFIRYLMQIQKLDYI